MDSLRTGERRNAGNMRLYDNWWERLAILARVVPVLLMLVGFVVFHDTMGYYWE